MRSILLVVFGLFALGACSEQSAELEGQQKPVDDSAFYAPNIILILADDMGYGDINTYNHNSKVPTPNLDALAAQGLRLTDAHSPSSVCTPTRYALLTGRYAWRTTLKRGVLYGRAPLLIEDDRDTIASALQEHGYKTAMIGKWHLGLGRQEATNYESELSPGPNSIGFDYFYGIPASLDMEPYVYVENTSLATPLTGKTIQASSFKRDGGGGKWRAGDIGDGFVHQDVLSKLTARSVDYIEQQAGSDSPFFLYFPLPAPHTPWLPDEEFRGVSGAGYYGDFASQVDGVVGQITAALRRMNIDENTIVIYTSDNGAHWKPSDIEEYGHLANGHLRGQKADIYEGGHRVPLIIRWPLKIPAGTSSDVTNTLTDLFPTLVSFANASLPARAAIDGEDLSQLFYDPQSSITRSAPVVHHSLSGMFAIRVDDWKLIEGLGSGGFSRPQRVEPEEGQLAIQLYNLANDPTEQENVAQQYPDIVKQLLEQLNKIRALEDAVID